MSNAFKNWKIVLLSLIGATTFWFFNALNKDYNARISYPMRFVFDKDSVVIMKPLPTTVVVDVSSGGWNLLRKTFWFNVSPITIELDNPAEIGFYTRSSLLPIVTEELKELTVNYLVTDTVYISIEEKKSKKVRLVMDSLTIPLEENHRLTSPISFSHDTVELIGPKSFIDTIGAYYPLQITTYGINSTYNRAVKVGVPSLGRSIPEEVMVNFSVDKFERLGIEVPVEPVNFPEDSSVYLEQSTVQIFYTIAKSQKETFRRDDFAVTADLSMLSRFDSTVLAILVYYPENAIEVDVIPENLKVTHER